MTQLTKENRMLYPSLLHIYKQTDFVSSREQCSQSLCIIHHIPKNCTLGNIRNSETSLVILEAQQL